MNLCPKCSVEGFWSEHEDYRVGYCNSCRYTNWVDKKYEEACSIPINWDIAYSDEEG